MSDERTVQITCGGTAEMLGLDDLSEFQGDLKTRTEEEVGKLMHSIERYGFSFPFFVWRQNGTNWCLDGHGRMTALLKLREVGWQIPRLPVVYIEAADRDEAKQKLLRMNSQYGHIARGDLVDFVEGLEISGQMPVLEK